MTMRNLLLAGAMAASVLFAGNASYAGTCSASDLSLTIGSTTYAPASCADTVAHGNTTDETANLNAALGTTGFVYLAKADNKDGNESSAGIGGIVFDVTTTVGNTGTWTISWHDTSPAPPNLPLTMDLEVGLFGGNNGSGYLFDDVLLTSNPNSGTGDFTISFFNNGDNHPKISHLTLTGGNVHEVVDAPEPMSIALVGTGLLGLGLIRRSRRS